MTLLDDGVAIGSTGGAWASPAHVDLRSDLPTRLADLGTMDRSALAAEWRRQFRAPPPDRIRRDLLELGIAWKLQEKALGGLKKSLAAELRDLAEALAATGDIRRAKAPRLKPGARLVREWGGVTHEVTVADGGFLWNGKAWTSLSAIAGEITGTHWSGPRFFGLAGGGKTVGRNKAKQHMASEHGASDA
ncbi:DUF2924 domain-containing protein [Xanthobacter aminoxidans]|uniref:DUF2924 domain-containing protein n=1 Tax=Xanthobacter aminoxidans TaxID=186280 RepID=UPI002022BAFB|nr:DUF2924 domain-containing protein [Xanthobacter aminoxidans]MCL8385892.1 DUF2924 domain-containing protein [Xanthobacter aminoxidans]